MEFEGRASCLGNFVPSIVEGGGQASNDCKDRHGHGTQVAGGVGGKTVGVAKKARLVSVRVCNSHGKCRSDAILIGLDKVLSANANHGKVVNLSLTSKSSSRAVTEALRAIEDSGGVVVQAAGNEALDACRSSLRTGITVGAVNKLDERAFFSNFGSCVDFWAPGVDIYSADTDPLASGASNTNSLYRSVQGTSHASPLVAGIVAMHLERGVLPENIYKELLSHAVIDRLKQLEDGSLNRLVHVPKGLKRIETVCPADMIKRECNRPEDCCRGYSCHRRSTLFASHGGRCAQGPDPKAKG